MTTTLRPVEPEQERLGGGRSRRFAVLVNSRPVGEVHLATDARFGPGTGRILALNIDERDRRRGRATIAALAAEEVLRGWGCRRIEAGIPADAGAALRLVTVLGYTERNRGMVKTTPAAPPVLPGGSVVRPMDEAEFDAWHARERVGYIQSWVDRGVTYEQATAKADADYRAALPDGHATADTVLSVLTHAGADVGTLWVRLHDRADPDGPAWVFTVEVAGEHRGNGHGRTLMLVAERECLAAGVPEIGLNVFADNTPAVRLYESLGYEPTSHHYFKHLL